MRGVGPKGPLFVTKWAKNGVLLGGWVQKVHFLAFRTPLKSILATSLFVLPKNFWWGHPPH